MTMRGEGEVSRCYEDSVVFLTGSTGFLGKVLLQKLLRVTLARKIFVLVRCKKGKTEAQRFADLFEPQIFDYLKKEQPDFVKRVELITGDCVQPNLGICDADLEKIRKNVNIVFHVAATVRFDQKLKTAAYINVRAVYDLLTQAKQFKQLKAFVHVSTAYSHCVRPDIGEKFYEPGMEPKKLLDLIEILDDKQLDEMTPKLLGEWPNTYAYTKCISEDVIRREFAGMPVAVVRPSIILGAYKEPLPGWIDNLYGPIGMTSAAAVGLMRSIYGHGENTVDFVPVDYVTNALIVAASKLTQQAAAKRENPTIYNFVSTPESPITWKYYTETCLAEGDNMPLMKAVYKPMFNITDRYWLHMLTVIFTHWLPAYLVDFACFCIGKKRMMVDFYTKLHTVVDVLQYFGLRMWHFENENTQQLWNELSDEDKKLYTFSMRTLVWKEYLPVYLAGGRLYLLKDPVESIPAAKKRMKKLVLLHRILMNSFVGVVLFIIYKLFF